MPTRTVFVIWDVDSCRAAYNLRIETACGAIRHHAAQFGNQLSIGVRALFPSIVTNSSPI